METYSLAQSTPTPQPVSNPAGGDTPPPKKFPKIAIIGGIAGGVLLLLFILLLLLGGGKKSSSQGVTAVPTEKPTVTPRVITSTTLPPANPSDIQYLPAKQYYDDSVAVISKADPRQVLMVSVSRFGQTSGFTQYSKVNYFNGKDWIRENVTSSIAQAKIVSNPLVKRLEIAPPIENTGQAKYGFDLTIKNQPISLTIQKMGYDVSAQAFQGYSKFNYFGEGRLKVPNDEFDVYVLYTRTFALNSSDVAFLSTPEKLESDWLVFWDEQGNAYYLDTLSSADQANPYQNYRLGAVFYANGTSTKVQRFQLSNSGQNNQYTVAFPLTEQVSLTFVLSNILNKSSVRAYRWQTGIITGTVQGEQTKFNGAGIMEVIHKN